MEKYDKKKVLKNNVNFKLKCWRDVILMNSFITVFLFVIYN